jgi:hypothetical protein
MINNTYQKLSIYVIETLSKTKNKKQNKNKNKNKKQNKTKLAFVIIFDLVVCLKK